MELKIKSEYFQVQKLKQLMFLKVWFTDHTHSHDLGMLVKNTALGAHPRPIKTASLRVGVRKLQFF